MARRSLGVNTIILWERVTISSVTIVIIPIPYKVINRIFTTLYGIITGSLSIKFSRVRYRLTYLIKCIILLYRCGSEQWLVLISLRLKPCDYTYMNTWHWINVLSEGWWSYKKESYFKLYLILKWIKKKFVRSAMRTESFKE